MNELDEYLRANRDAFTREVLTRRLVEEGHDPAEVALVLVGINGACIAGALAGNAVGAF